MEYSLIAAVVSMRGVLQWQYHVSVTGQYYTFSVSDIDRFQSHDDLAVLAVIVGHNPAAIVTTSDQGFVGDIMVKQWAGIAP